MDFPLIANAPYYEMVVRVAELGDGSHRVEKLSDGGFLQVVKPGYLGPNDFSVHRLSADCRTLVETPRHTDFLYDLSEALKLDRARAMDFVKLTFAVFGGREAPGAALLPGSARPGDYVLKALKWIWAQEDTNFPIDEGNDGRLMAGYRLQELVDGVPYPTVHRRAEGAGRRPDRIPGVRYRLVDEALLTGEYSG